ncbi:MAG: hypothetical protein VKK80_07825 [Prochlorothrix sp.]|nr:hypothetical protein [Prochlorothrix sp.]
MAPNSWQFPVQRSWRSGLVGSVLVLGGVLSSAMASLMAAPIAQATPPDRFLSGSGEETNAGILAVPHLGLGDMALAPGEAPPASGTDRRGDRPSTPSPIAPTIAEAETPALDSNLDPNNVTPGAAPLELRLERRRPAPEPDAILPLFQPHLATILQSLPAHTQLRLPPQLLFPPSFNLDPSQLYVQVLASRTPAIATVSLLTCEGGVFPCWVGSITVEPKFAANGPRELERHRTDGKPITLGPNLKGYLWDGLEQRPPYGVSSVMWEQDNSIYTLSFPAQGRQELLFMALYMSRTAPVTPPMVGGR